MKTFLISIILLAASSALSAQLVSEQIPVKNQLESPNQERVDSLKCSEYPGTRICNKARRLESLLYTCRNNCLPLFRRHIRLSHSISDYFLESGAADFDSAHRNVGQLAQQTAYRLCGYSVQGQRDVILRMQHAYNRVLVTLKELQVMASIERVAFCQFTTN